MPRTRNITRAQWEAATADPSTSAIRPSAGSTASNTHLRRRGQPSHESSFIYADSASADSSLKENRGYDREYDEDNDENVDNENLLPTVVVTSKGKGKEQVPPKGSGRKRKPQPLQDITDLVVSHGNRPDDVEETPRGGRRIKRRRQERQPLALVDPPLSTTVRRTRTPNTRKTFPSSLPPSSPPPPASLEIPTSSAPQRNDVWDDALPEEQEELPLASDDPEQARSSDPFGFFAVERELKAQRDRDIRPFGELREGGGLVLVPASSPPPLHLDMAAVLGDDGEGKALVSPCATPTTPHKKKQERRVTLLDKGKGREELLFSPHTESLPSSPSPIKARTPYVKQKVLRHRRYLRRSSPAYSSAVVGESNGSGDEDGGDEKVKETPPSRVLRSRAKEKQSERPHVPLPLRKTRAKHQREDKSKTPSDPVELAQKLISRLPKRRKKTGGENGDEDELKVVKSRPTKRRRKPQPSKKMVKDAKRLKVELEVNPERASIRDYFKKLEDYSLEEEKVYVI